MRVPLFGKVLLATLVPLAAFAALGWTANQLAHRAHRVARQAHYLARQEAEAELGRRLVATAQTAAALLRAEDVALLQPGDEGTRTYRRIQAALRRVAKATGSRRIYLVDRARRSLCDSRPGVPIGAPYYHLDVETPLLRRVFETAGTGASMLFRGQNGVDYKAGFAPLLAEGKGRPVAAVAVEGSAGTFRHLRRLDRQLQELRAGLLAPWHVALLAGVGLLLLVGASLLLARSVTRPVRHLMRAAAAIGRGELERPVRPQSRDEIGVLAEALDRMRSDLLARQRELQLMLSGIAHEVRNPLGGMALFAGLLADELAGDPERAAMVARIQKELESLDRIVNEFLEFARDIPIDRRPLDLRDLARDVAELCAPDADEAGVSLLGPEAGAPVPIQGDSDKLRRAILNVLRNAVQACRRGDRVTVTVEPEAEPGLHALRCADTGAGIPPEVRDRIFEAFFTTREQGTGLGLAFAQKIVAAHGGQIRVDSHPGAGTTVSLLLPAVATTAATAPEPEVPLCAPQVAQNHGTERSGPKDQPATDDAPGP